MKRRLYFVLIALLCAPVFGLENSGPKYNVLKTTHFATPLREEANVDARRFSHLDKGVSVYSDYENENFFRISLGLNKYYWIEKKYLNLSKSAKNIKTSKIKKIKVLEDKNYQKIEIKTDTIFPYSEEEGENSVALILYNSFVSDNIIKKAAKNGVFDIKKGDFNTVKISTKRNSLISGYDVSKNGNTLVFKVRKPFEIDKNKPLKNLVFVIDAGHGGNEQGAVAFNLKEKDINLQISKILYDELEKEGAKVYLTRNKDEYLGLYERVQFAKNVKADFLLSIHQNSLPNRKNVNKKHGTGVYYYNKETLPLAFEVENSLVEKTGFRNDGVNYASFALNRPTSPISLLIECGYIIHPEEAKKLSDPEFQKIVSNGIVQGVKNYLIKNY